MTVERHPDIEVYVKNGSVPQLIDWVQTQSSQIGPLNSAGNNHQFSAEINGHVIPVMIQERVAGKGWLSIWFRSDQTPWATDLECAKAISNALDTQTRCILNGWSEGDEPDEWWLIEQGNQEKILWRT